MTCRYTTKSFRASDGSVLAAHHVQSDAQLAEDIVVLHANGRAPDFLSSAQQRTKRHTDVLRSSVKEVCHLKLAFGADCQAVSSLLSKCRLSCLGFGAQVAPGAA
jgi:hypothetical protein